MNVKRWLSLVLICCFCLWGCSQSSGLAGEQSNATLASSSGTDVPETLAKATFAGGCFWCMEKPFDTLKGVIDTTSGYTGGERPDPTYRQVSSGQTGHAEAVQVRYDSDQISYEALLDVFWKNVDPLDSKGQFCDRGSQYRTEIFYHTEDQKTLANTSKETLSKTLPTPIVTPVTAATDFYPAEDYHQDYYLKNPLQYKVYRFSCGRDQRLAELWGEETAH